MTGFWYRLLLGITRCLGPWVLVAFSRFVAAGYFLFSPRRTDSQRFYAALYPDRSACFHLWCVFRQFQNFTTIHLDRFLRAQGEPIHCTSEGWEHLEAVIGRQGGVLVMSHLGNWEMAARTLKEKASNLKLLLYMGVKEKEGVERAQKEELRRAGVTIVGVGQEESDPFAALEAIRFLRAGGLVSMTGDVVWRADQRSVRVPFLGREARLPEAPYLFSLLSGSPLFAFFVLRTGRNRYHLSLSRPIVIPPHARQDREAALASAAGQYAGLLEAQLRTHPFQWYHFERFLS